MLDPESLTYNDYLKIPELLSLQKPLSVPVHGDEMLFIIIHQAYELWFKIILIELENARSEMDRNEVLRARHFVSRVVQIMKLLVNQIHILETMTPAEFLKFRYRLNPASGFQSLQFREVEFLCGLKDRRYFQFFKDRPDLIKPLETRFQEPDLGDAFFGMLSRLGFALPADSAQKVKAGDEPVRKKVTEVLKKIHQDSHAQLPLFLLCESLIELDEQFVLWRNHHVLVVERIIGLKRGTGGSSGVEYLKTRQDLKCFPLLWEVRTALG